MEIKEKFKGSFVFVKSLDKLIEVTDKNIEAIKEYKHLFNDIPKKTKRKYDRSNGKGDDNNGNSELSI